MSREIIISGEIGWDVTPASVREQLVDANGEDIGAKISSAGGFVSDALEIYNIISGYKGRKTALLVGYAMSSASYIPMAFDEIVAEENAVFMIHNVRGGVWGDHNEIIKYGGFCKALSGILARSYTARTGRNLSEIASMMDQETYFIGEEIKNAGFADSVIKSSKDEDASASKASAMAAMQSVVAKMRGDERFKSDLEQAMAIGKVITGKTEEFKPKSIKYIEEEDKLLRRIYGYE